MNVFQWSMLVRNCLEGIASRLRQGNRHCSLGVNSRPGVDESTYREGRGRRVE